VQGAGRHVAVYLGLSGGLVDMEIGAEVGGAFGGHGDAARQARAGSCWSEAPRASSRLAVPSSALRGMVEQAPVRWTTSSACLPGRRLFL